MGAQPDGPRGDELWRRLMAQNSKDTGAQSVAVLEETLADIRKWIAKDYKYSRSTSEFWRRQYVQAPGRGKSRAQITLHAEIAVLLAMNCGDG